MSKKILLVIIIFLILTLTVIGYVVLSNKFGNDKTVASAQEETPIIELRNMSFTPKIIKVKPGQKIVVLNKDILSHTLTSSEKGLFDTGNLGRGESREIIAPSVPGTYNYLCTLHSGMSGSIIVESN